MVLNITKTIVAPLTGSGACLAWWSGDARTQKLCLNADDQFYHVPDAAGARSNVTERFLARNVSQQRQNAQATVRRIKIRPSLEA